MEDEKIDSVEVETDAPVQGKRSASQKAISKIVISAMMLALAFVLNLITKQIPFLNMPNGGSISIEGVPLVLASLYCGPFWGMGIGVVFGLLDALIGGGFAYHWASILLDYIVAFGFVGLAGLFSKQFFEKKAWAPIAGMGVYGIARFVASFLSGVIVWNEFYNYDAGTIKPDFSWGSISYSFLYNGFYMIPSAILCVIIFCFITRPLFPTFRLTYIKSIMPKGVATTDELTGKLQTYTVLKFAILIMTLLLDIFGFIPYTGETAVTCAYGLGYVGIVACLMVIVFELVYYKKRGLEDKNKILVIALSTLVLIVNVVLVIVGPLAICHTIA